MGSSSDRFWLHPNIVFEPLINGWYAWPHLVSPATSALHALYQLRIMDSFVQNPKLHLAASRNPAMRGGSFLAFDGDPREIAAIAAATRAGSAELLELGTALGQAAELLARAAHGESLEPLYAQLPAPLRGLVELSYDLDNHASLRVIEALLYASRCQRGKRETLSLAALANPDDRAFVFSTPRVKTAGTLHIDLEFRSPLVDALFRARRDPIEGAAIAQLADGFRLGRDDTERFRSFFTSEPPPAAEPVAWEADEIRVQYFGHACVLLASATTSILVDPGIAYANPEGVERYSFHDLPDRIDAVLLTHNHQDHVLLETLLQLRHKIGTIVVPPSSGRLHDPSLKWMLRSVGFANVVELDELETFPVGDGEITGVPFFGEHGDLDIRAKLGYCVQLRGRKILLLADSNNVDPRLYDHVHDRIGDVDCLFIGMECVGAPVSWLYGPLFPRPLARNFDQSRRLNGSDCARAKLIIERFRPPRVFVYAMGAEPWLTYLSSIVYTPESTAIVQADLLLDHCRASSIAAERLFGRKLLRL